MIVDRINGRDVSAERFFTDYVVENQPVILTNLCEDWPARKWTADSLVDQHGEREISVAPLREDGLDKWFEDSKLWVEGDEESILLPGMLHADRVLAVAAARVKMSVAEFCRTLQNSSHARFFADGANNVEKRLSFLSDDLGGAPSVARYLNPRPRNLWIGGATVSSLHIDNFENLFFQMHGDKKFLLIPPGTKSFQTFIKSYISSEFEVWFLLNSSI